MDGGCGLISVTYNFSAGKLLELRAVVGKQANTLSCIFSTPKSRELFIVGISLLVFCIEVYVSKWSVYIMLCVNTCSH